MEHFHKEVSEPGMIGYIEGLKDLRPCQVEFACNRALKECMRMPVVADIRQRMFTGEAMSGKPAYLDEPIAPESERWTAEEEKASEELRNLVRGPETIYKLKSPSKPIGDQKEELRKRGYLA